MGIDTHQLRHFVVRPVLQQIDLYSPIAEELMLATAAHETAMGKYLKQIKGPALGIFQMEPATHTALARDFLRFRRRLDWYVRKFLVGSEHIASQLVWNLAYATAMSRVFYLRCESEDVYVEGLGIIEREPLPTRIEDMGRYWKKHYNTHLGKGTHEHFMENYRRYVLLGVVPK